MNSIGLDLQRWVKKGRLQFQTVRPFHYGLEMHLARTIRLVAEFEPQVVIVDQMSGLETTGTPLELKAAMMRLIDFLKMKGITAMYTDLTTDDHSLALTDTAISSLVDTWLILRDLELNGERNRGLHILKSRGMAHSNQVREFIMSERGIELKDIYIGPSGMLTGSARVAQEAQERAQHVTRSEEIERQQLDLKRKHDALEGQIAALRAEFSAEEARIERIISHDLQREESLAQDEVEMGRSRKNDVAKTVRSVIPRNGGNGRKS
jgi:circadian clock protein KaiC